MTELEKALAGEEFDRRAEDIRIFQGKVKDLCFEFNHTKPSDPRRSEIIKELVTGYNPMILMIVSVFICLFISEDFRSGFAKNLFTVRARKGDYVASKTISGFICGALMLIAYFVGSLLGGAISGLSFDLHGLTMGNIAMCMVAKIFLMLVFVAIDVIVSVAAKQKAWLCLCGSLGAGMLLFMTVSLITPLGSTFMNVVLCLAGGVLFAIGLGVGSNKILNKTSLV